MRNYTESTTVPCPGCGRDLAVTFAVYHYRSASWDGPEEGGVPEDIEFADVCPHADCRHEITEEEDAAIVRAIHDDPPELEYNGPDTLDEDDR